VKQHIINRKTAKPQVRGFVPVQGSATLNQSEVAPVPEIKQPAAKAKPAGKVKTVADETKIVLTKANTKKSGATKVPEEVEDTELGDLLGKLDKSKK